MLNSHSVLSFC